MININRIMVNSHSVERSYDKVKKSTGKSGGRKFSLRSSASNKDLEKLIKKMENCTAELSKIKDNEGEFGGLSSKNQNKLLLSTKKVLHISKEINILIDAKKINASKEMTERVKLVEKTLEKRIESFGLEKGKTRNPTTEALKGPGTVTQKADSPLKKSVDEFIEKEKNCLDRINLINGKDLVFKDEEGLSLIQCLEKAELITPDQSFFYQYFLSLAQSSSEKINKAIEEQVIRDSAGEVNTADLTWISKVITGENLEELTVAVNLYTSQEELEKGSRKNPEKIFNGNPRAVLDDALNKALEKNMFFAKQYKEKINEKENLILSPGTHLFEPCQKLMRYPMSIKAISDRLEKDGKISTELNNTYTISTEYVKKVNESR